MRAPNSASSHPFAAALSAVARFAAAIREAGEHRRVVRNLASLDDHMLRDIGLTRFAVDSTAPWSWPSAPARRGKVSVPWHGRPRPGRP